MIEFPNLDWKSKLRIVVDAISGCGLVDNEDITVRIGGDVDSTMIREIDECATESGIVVPETFHAHLRNTGEVNVCWSLARSAAGIDCISRYDDDLRGIFDMTAESVMHAIGNWSGFEDSFRYDAEYEWGRTTSFKQYFPLMMLPNGDFVLLHEQQGEGSRVVYLCMEDASYMPFMSASLEGLFDFFASTGCLGPQYSLVDEDRQCFDLNAPIAVGWREFLGLPKAM